MKPIGHDGKQMSDHAWRKWHSHLAKWEEKYNVIIVNKEELEDSHAKGA